VTAAIGLYRTGGKLASPRDAAWLALALARPEVRDDAWARMLPGHARDHLRLWTDLTVLAPGGYTAAPAALLAFTAWQAGDGALGNVALDRALADDPRYRMAVLIRAALGSGAPPSMACPPMTPEEVAAAYGYAARPGKTSDAKACRSAGRKQQQRQRRRRQARQGEAPGDGAPGAPPRPRPPDPGSSARRETPRMPPGGRSAVRRQGAVHWPARLWRRWAPSGHRGSVPAALRLSRSGRGSVPAD